MTLVPCFPSTLFFFLEFINPKNCKKEVVTRHKRRRIENIPLFFWKSKIGSKKDRKTNSASHYFPRFCLDKFAEILWRQITLKEGVEKLTKLKATLQEERTEILKLSQENLKCCPEKRGTWGGSCRDLWIGKCSSSTIDKKSGKTSHDSPKKVFPSNFPNENPDYIDFN